MLTTPFGRIKIIADGHEIAYEAIPYNSTVKSIKLQPLTGSYRIIVPAWAYQEIRSADGPTAVVVGIPQEAAVHSACSGLYFEKQKSVEWRMSFRVKMVDDAEIRLI